MCATHPFADLRFFFTQHFCKIFLLQSLFYKNLVDSVYNLKREINITSGII